MSWFCREEVIPHTPHYKLAKSDFKREPEPSLERVFTLRSSGLGLPLNKRQTGEARFASQFGKIECLLILTLDSQLSTLSCRIFHGFVQLTLG